MEFSDVRAVSLGGIKNLDKLQVKIVDPLMFGFQEKEIYNAEKERYEMIRPTLKHSELLVTKIPKQADMEDPIVASAQTVAKTIEVTMDGILIGSVAINFIVAVSLKQILTAIRVMQIVAFLSFVEINFTPISMIFMKSIYNFTTFKVIPQTVIDKIE